MPRRADRCERRSGSESGSTPSSFLSESNWVMSAEGDNRQLTRFNDDAKAETREEELQEAESEMDLFHSVSF